MIVQIRGLKLKILRRKALDVIQLAEYVRRSSDKLDSTNQIFQFAMIVRDSLKLNTENLPWWQFLRKFFIRRAVTLNSIMGLYSLQELSELALEVFKAEGLTENELENLKKKAIPPDTM